MRTESNPNDKLSISDLTQIVVNKITQKEQLSAATECFKDKLMVNYNIKILKELKEALKSQSPANTLKNTLEKTGTW